MQREIQVNEKLPAGPGILLSVQHLFAMFGSTVLVPNIFGVDPGMILLLNGIGTYGSAVAKSLPISAPASLLSLLSVLCLKVTLAAMAMQWPWVLSSLQVLFSVSSHW